MTEGECETKSLVEFFSSRTLLPAPSALPSSRRRAFVALAPFSIKEKHFLGSMHRFKKLRRSKSICRTSSSLPLEGKVDRAARRMRCSRKAALFLCTALKKTDAPHHALSVALRRQLPQRGEPYVCAMRWFGILQKRKSVRGTI